MAAFLYFVEGHRTPVTLELLREWGLSYAFDSVPHHQEVMGPSGATGMLLCDAERLRPFMPAYREEEQTWRKVPAAGAESQVEGATIWIGFYSEARPTRDDLARDAMLPGYEVELADGLAWQVPLVRQVTVEGTSECLLPAYLDLDERGEATRGEVVEQHRWLWQQCEPFWAAWFGAWNRAIDLVAELPEGASDDETNQASRFAVDCPTLLGDAVAVLGANYRIGLVEAMAMQLFRTDGGYGEIMKAACDTDRAAVYLQKKTSCPAEST